MNEYSYIGIGAGILIIVLLKKYGRKYCCKQKQEQTKSENVIYI